MSEQFSEKKIILGKEIREPGLREILNAPKSEKRAMLERFRKELGQGGEKLISFQRDMVQAVTENIEASPEELQRLFQETAVRHNVSPAWQEIGRMVLERFVAKRQKIKEVRKQFPDETALFRALFGRDPGGNIEVREEPMLLIFVLEDAEDYAYVRAGIRGGERVLNAEEKKFASGSGGTVVRAPLIPELANSVVVENKAAQLGMARKTAAESAPRDSPVDSPERVERIYQEAVERGRKHEVWHVFSALFADEARTMTTRLELLEALREVAEKQDRSEKIVLLRRACRQFRLPIEARAKEELLAYLVAGGKTSQDIYEILTEPREKGGLYDYARNEKDWLFMTSGDMEDEDIALFLLIFDEVFGEEYKKLLREGLGAFSELEKSGFTVGEAATFLMHKPLREWKKAVGRQLAAKTRQGE